MNTRDVLDGLLTEANFHQMLIDKGICEVSRVDKKELKLWCESYIIAYGYEFPEEEE